MEQLFTNLVGSTNDFLWSKLLIIMLFVCRIYFTFKSKIVQFRMLKEMVVVLMEGKNSSKDQVSPFQAFCIGMAARVRTGNIIGIAIALGGPRAVFWMLIISIMYFILYLNETHSKPLILLHLNVNAK